MSDSKYDRWQELVELLLKRESELTREDVILQLAAYGRQWRRVSGGVQQSEPAKFESARRKFERDKVDLRRMGITIEVTRGAKSSTGGRAPATYRVRPALNRPVRLLPCAPDDLGPLPRGPYERPITWEELRSAEQGLARLALGPHPLRDAAASARRGITAAAADPEATPGTAIPLMPQEMLALSVALAVSQAGADLAMRIAGAGQPDIAP